MGLTQKRLKELLYYDPETGIFTWEKGRTGTAFKGSVAGNINTTGYIRIKIDGKLYNAGRLAFFYMTGSFPKLQIDHINRIRTDNKWNNLRDVSPETNSINKKVRKDNISGISGITWNKDSKKWRVGIRVKKKQIFLGYFNNLCDAAMSRWEAEKKYNFTKYYLISSAYLFLKNQGVVK